MGEYLTFKKLITPTLVQVLFWVLIVITVIVAFSESFFRGLLLLVVGVLLARVYCEILIVVFQINNTLTEVRDNQLLAAAPES